MCAILMIWKHYFTSFKQWPTDFWFSYQLFTSSSFSFYFFSWLICLWLKKETGVQTCHLCRRRPPWIFYVKILSIAVSLSMAARNLRYIGKIFRIILLVIFILIWWLQFKLWSSNLWSTCISMPFSNHDLGQNGS